MGDGKSECRHFRNQRTKKEWVNLTQMTTNINYCGQESLKRNRVAIIVNKSLKCSIRMQSQKRQNDLCSFPRNPFNIMVIQVYAPTSDAEEAEVEQFYEDLQDF